MHLPSYFISLPAKYLQTPSLSPKEETGRGDACIGGNISNCDIIGIELTVKPLLAGYFFS